MSCMVPGVAGELARRMTGCAPAPWGHTSNPPQHTGASLELQPVQKVQKVQKVHIVIGNVEMFCEGVSFLLLQIFGSSSQLVMQWRHQRTNYAK